MRYLALSLVCLLCGCKTVTMKFDPPSDGNRQVITVEGQPVQVGALRELCVTYNPMNDKSMADDCTGIGIRAKFNPWDYKAPVDVWFGGLWLRGMFFTKGDKISITKDYNQVGFFSAKDIKADFSANDAVSEPKRLYFKTRPEEDSK